MKIAYLVDREAIGGGMEYVRRKREDDARNGRESRLFCADKGECRSALLDAWGADVIVVNHLKALVQLLGRPWSRPTGRVRMVVHGLHLRKYDWRIRECDGAFAGLKRTKLRICRALRRNLEAWLYRRCDEIVALTETDRRDILRLYGATLTVAVEPNTLGGWTPSPSATPPPGFAGPYDYVCLGRFDYPKGQDRWIRAMAHSGETAHTTLFIGDGERLETCRRLAETLGVAARCAFAGAIPEGDRYLTCAKAVVSPSRWEGMPYAMMKARALGCRVLATDCPGNRDVLDGYANWERLDL